MTVTDRTAASEQEFRDRIAPFESAPTPPEVREAAVLEEVARALSRAEYPANPWELQTNGWREHRRRLAAAAVAAYRAQDGGAEEARHVRTALVGVAEDLEWAATKQDRRDVALGFTAAAGRVWERLELGDESR